MAATRYLVEGDRLDVLIGQVKRMGRRVTVLKAEKVRKGGLAGMFAKEHYEVLVEVEGVGEPPETFKNATATGTTEKPKPTHKTLSEQAEEAGLGGKKKAPPRANPTEPGNASPETIDDGSADATNKKDAGLEHLLDEARSQLSSNTEAAQAQLESQMAQLGIGDAAALLEEPVTPEVLPAPSGGAMMSGTGATLAGASAVGRTSGFDARLQGVAAPGASSGRPAPAPAPAPNATMVPAAALTELGFPAELFADVPGAEDMAQAAATGNLATGELDLEAVLDALPHPVELLEKPDSTIVVVGPSPIALSIVETAQRLAGRLGEDAYCVLGGPKTTLPGEALRARSAEELKSLMEARPGKTCVLALSDSLIEAHRRTMAKLISVIYVDQTWAVVDGRNAVDRIESWIRGLPDAIRPDALAVQRIWESDHPGALFEVGIPMGMLDGVPARSEAWKMLLEDIFSTAQ